MNYIHPYSFKPDPKFHHIDDLVDYADNLFMGVELEIDGSSRRDECSTLLHESDPNEELFYQKHDGSLSWSGIEVVTHPATLAYHMKQFPWFDICETAKECEYTERPTCGLHVHVSRDGLGDNEDQQNLTIAKLLLLFSGFWKQIVVFTRREARNLSRWARKSNQKFFVDEGETKLLDKAKNARWATRYSAINLRNRDTVEFRVFAGTLNSDTIIATLQFVSNLIAFAKATKISELQGADWHRIMHYHEYPELNAYLKNVGLDVRKKMRGIVHPKVRYITAKAGMHIMNVDGSINHDAYDVHTVTFNEFVEKYPRFDGPQYRAVVALMEPRSDKIERIYQVRSVTNAGNVRFMDTFNRPVAQTRIAYVLFEDKEEPIAIEEYKRYFAKLDGQWRYAIPAGDITGNPCWCLYSRGSRVVYTDNVEDVTSIQCGDPVVVEKDGVESVYSVDGIFGSHFRVMDDNGQFDYMFCDQIGTEWNGTRWKLRK